MKIETMLDKDMKNCVMRNDLTGEIKIVKCDNENIACDFCVDYYRWKKGYITYLFSDDNYEIDDIVYTERRA